MSPQPFLGKVLSEKAIAAYKQLHDESQPYTHIVLDPLCDREQMVKVQAEAKNNLSANFKETDLFKVYQTGELGNFDANDPDMKSKFPELLKLREAIYSKEFRDVISKIMGVDDLTDRVDCSCNAYTQGCHLICHDDVIGTRRISYIIYLTDPDEVWREEDGGALELYPIDDDTKVKSSVTFQGIPTPTPTRKILPTFNSMALFKVQPGRSYHSVEEVYTEENPRLSISGWFHGPTPPVGADLASLKQIMTKGDNDRDFTSFHDDDNISHDTSIDEYPKKRGGENGNKPKGIGGGSKNKSKCTIISPQDLAVLSKWVNPVYLEDAAIKRISKRFCNDSSIQLKDFIIKTRQEEMSRLIKVADTMDQLGNGRPPVGYEVGVGNQWKLVGPPHKRRHLVLDEYSDESGKIGGKKRPHPSSSSSVHPTEAVGDLMLAIKDEIFTSGAFSRYLEKLTSLRPTGYRHEIRRFRPGLDYTVAHYGAMTKVPRLDATLCFVEDDDSSPPQRGNKVDNDVHSENSEEEDDDMEGEDLGGLWDGGDVGAFECYISADNDGDAEDLEAAEVFETELDNGNDNRKGNISGDKDDEDDDDDDDDELLSVTPGCNVLSLVMRNENIMRFIKYVGANAPGSRWDIAMDYAIDVDDDDDDDDSTSS